MASPQVENGYTRIANELLEAILLADLTKNELKVLFCLIRESYGRGKKQVKISHRTIAKMTSISRSNVTRSVKSLVSKQHLNGVKTTPSGPKSVTTYKVNKNYEKWSLLVSKQHLPIMVSKQHQNRCQNDTNKHRLPSFLGKKERKYAKHSKRWVYQKLMPVPKDFYLTDELKSYGEKLLTENELDIDLEVFTENFILKCKSKGRKYKNYIAAWQTWLRNQIKWDLEKRARNNTESVQYGELKDGFEDDI